MKNCLICILSFIVFSFLWGCSGASFLKSEVGNNNTVKADTSYEFQMKEIMKKTEPRFIDNLLNSMQLPTEMLNMLSGKDRIIVTSLERAYHSDNDVQVMTDRYFIKKLLSSSFNVLDREEHVLIASFAENNKNAGDMLNLLTLRNSEGLSIKIPYNLSQTATKILSYRVLELGVTKIPQNNSDLIKRFGNAEIEIRLVDASTTQILYTDIIRGNYEDLITKKEKQLVDNMHYRFEPDALPLSAKYQSKDFVTDNLNPGIGSKFGRKLQFQKGGRDSEVQVINHEKQIIAANFVVPKAIAREDTFIYFLPYIDKDGHPLPDGKYSIVIDGYTMNEFSL